MVLVPEFIRRMFPDVDFDYEDDPDLEDDDDDQEYWPPEGVLTPPHAHGIKAALVQAE